MIIVLCPSHSEPVAESLPIGIREEEEEEKASLNPPSNRVVLVSVHV